MLDQSEMLNEPDFVESSEISSVPRQSSVAVVARERRAPTEQERAEAQEMDRLEFLQQTLHDLQSSVAVLDVSAALLVEDLTDADSAVRVSLGDIQRATLRVQQYVDHLVTSERLGSGRMQLRREHVDLVPLLESVIGDYVRHARNAGATVCLDIGESTKIGLRADAVLLRRVVQNLLENALRHVAKGGRILVQARVTSVVEIRVFNDGPPIPDALRDGIFDKFSVAASSRGAAGLGLYFCRAAVRAHGGMIALESCSDWATCFVVRLPRAII